MQINISEEMARMVIEVARGYAAELERQISLTTARTPVELARKEKRIELARHAREVKNTFLELADLTEEEEWYDVQ